MNEDLIKKYSARITSANRGELTSIIYDIIVEELTLAESDMKSDSEKACSELTKARELVNELLNTLDLQYDVSGNLARLYIYVNKCINHALVKKSAEEIKEAVHIMSELGAAFKKIAESDDSDPLMKDTESIYAGLTYGRGMTVDEVAVRGDSDRDFRV